MRGETDRQRERERERRLDRLLPAIDVLHSARTTRDLCSFTLLSGLAMRLCGCSGGEACCPLALANTPPCKCRGQRCRRLRPTRRPVPATAAGPGLLHGAVHVVTKRQVRCVIRFRVVLCLRLRIRRPPFWAPAIPCGAMLALADPPAALLGQPCTSGPQFGKACSMYARHFFSRPR